MITSPISYHNILKLTVYVRILTICLNNTREKNIYRSGERKCHSMRGISYSDIWRVSAIFLFYDTTPFLLQEMVIYFVKSFEIPSACVAITFAVAEFPLLLEEMDLIVHVFAGAEAL